MESYNKDGRPLRGPALAPVKPISVKIFEEKNLKNTDLEKKSSGIPLEYSKKCMLAKSMFQWNSSGIPLDFQFFQNVAFHFQNLHFLKK